MLLLHEFLTAKRFERSYLGLELSGDPTQLIEQLRTAITAAKPSCIVADSIAEHLFADTDEDRWTKDDFACLVPLAPLFWIECRRPSRIRSAKRGDIDPAILPTRWGCLFAGGVKDPAGRLGDRFAAMDPRFAASCRRPGWYMIAHLVLQLEGGALLTVPLQRLSSINERGYEEEARWLGAGNAPAGAEERAFLRDLVNLFYPHLLTIRLLNEQRVDMVCSTLPDGIELCTLGQIVDPRTDA